MLLRTALLLLLCASLGLSATLGHYQAQVREPVEEETKREEEAAAANPAGFNDNVVVAAEPEGDDASAPEEVTETLAVDQPAVDDSEGDVPVGDGATTEEPEADTDTPAEDTPVADTPAEETPVADTPITDTPAEETPVEDAPVADTPAEDTPVADTPADDTPAEDTPADDTAAEDTSVADTSDTDTPAEDTAAADTPADDVNAVEAHTEETPAVEAISQELPPAEEETNEIRPVEASRSQDKPPVIEESSWSFNSIRSGFQAMHGYFDSMVELVGGHNGVCQYRCRHGEIPQPRPGHQPEPNGCSSSLVGMQLDLGIPAMTNCCNKLDLCYDTCGTNKYDCDAAFRSCVLDICTDLRESLGFVSQVQACDSMANILHNTVRTLGCRSYMSSQRAACICEDEERDEL